MGLKLGNTKLGQIYLGNTKIGQVYKGSNLIYQATQPVINRPYMIFEFTSGSARLTAGSGASGYVAITQISTSPNRWKLEVLNWYEDHTQPQLGRGIPLLFCASGTQYTGTITSLCTLIEAGNFDAMLGGYYCESMDRAFTGCTGLTALDDVIEAPYVTNVGGMFQNCTNVASGQLDQYNWFNTYGTNITNHSGTFTNCGANSQTGLLELNQIPVGWGGNLVPASTLMTSARGAYSSTLYSYWTITGNAPDWENVTGMYVFTSGSVSKFAGVSMNRSRIPNGLNGFSAASGNALYFYPAFVQCTSAPGTAGNVVTWIATTDIPNGSLTSSQGNTDMPGTLDYSTYGPITRTYGIYDDYYDVCFVFLVTNYPITDYDPMDYNSHMIPLGFLYNSAYNADASLRYFF